MHAVSETELVKIFADALKLSPWQQTLDFLIP